MTRARINWNAPSWSRESFYTDEEIEKLIGIVGELPANKVGIDVPAPGGMKFASKMVSRRDALAHLLEQAAKNYAFQSGWSARPTALMKKRQFFAIAAAAKRLGAALKILPDFDMEKMPEDLRYGGLQAQAAIDESAQRHDPEFNHREPIDTGGARLLCDAVAGIARIEKWSRLAAGREDSNLKAAPAGRRKSPRLDAHFDQWCCQLKTAWLKVKCALPGHGERSPFVRFLAAASRALARAKLIESPISENSARQRLRRIAGRTSS